jgi:hypothetical protein
LSYYAAMRSFGVFFSGGHIGRPVSKTPSGEGNAITIRWFSESDLTLSADFDRNPGHHFL